MGGAANGLGAVNSKYTPAKNVAGNLGRWKSKEPSNQYATSLDNEYKKTKNLGEAICLILVCSLNA